MLNLTLPSGNAEGNGASREVFPLGSRRVEGSSISMKATRARRAQGATQVVAQVTGRRHRAARRAPRLVTPLPVPSSTALSWRERPRDLTASAIMPAATAEVAHATPAVCHRLNRRAQTCATRRSDPDGISDVDGALSRAPSLPGFQTPTRKRLTPRGGPRQRAVVGAGRER